MSHTQEPWANPYYSTEMSADKVDRVNAVLVPADKLAAMQDRIVELERKLAEQQAKYTIQRPVGYIRGYGVECLQGTLVNTVTGQTPLPSSTRITPYMETDSDIPLYAKPMAVSNVELTNLLAKAKEEGRKEAVPEVGNIREVNLTGDFVVKLVFKSCRAASSFVEFIR